MSELVRLFDATQAGIIRSHATGFCPCHDDQRNGGKRSLSIEIKKKKGDIAPALYIWCRSCGANGVDVAKALGIKWHLLSREVVNVPLGKTKRPKQKLPTGVEVVKAHQALQKNAKRYRFLTDDRLITKAVIAERLIGWDAKRDRYLFPIFDELWFTPSSPETLPVDGCLWYPGSPFENGTRKMCNWRGWPSALYPNDAAASGGGMLFICEGELDALCVISREINAISGTTGARHWNNGWNRCIDSNRPIVTYDCDDAGRKGVEAVAESLRSDGIDCAVLDLDPTRNDGFDLTDFFRIGGTRDELLDMGSRAWKGRDEL